MKRFKFWCLLFLMGGGLVLWGQDTGEQQKDSLFDESSSTFLAVPLVNNSPAMDTGFGAMGMYFFRLNSTDEESPPSLVSLYAIYTTNKSYIFTPFGRFFWNEDKNRASFGFGTVRVNNDFIYDEMGNDLRLVYSELRNFVTFEYSRRVIGDFYIGGLYLGTKTSYKFDQASDEVNDFTREFFEQNGITDNFVSSIGLNFSFDNRDYPYYPTRGFTFKFGPNSMPIGWEAITTK